MFFFKSDLVSQKKCGVTVQKGGVIPNQGPDVVFFTGVIICVTHCWSRRSYAKKKENP